MGSTDAEPRHKLDFLPGGRLCNIACRIGFLDLQLAFKGCHALPFQSSMAAVSEGCLIAMFVQASSDAAAEKVPQKPLEVLHLVLTDIARRFVLLEVWSFGPAHHNTLHMMPWFCI